MNRVKKTSNLKNEGTSLIFSSSYIDCLELVNFSINNFCIAPIPHQSLYTLFY
jgi:hypothetical protein